MTTKDCIQNRAETTRPRFGPLALAGDEGGVPLVGDCFLEVVDTRFGGIVLDRGRTDLHVVHLHSGGPLEPSANRADAVLAASVFHYGEYTVPQAKRYLAERGIEVRV